MAKSYYYGGEASTQNCTHKKMLSTVFFVPVSDGTQKAPSKVRQRSSFLGLQAQGSNGLIKSSSNMVGHPCILCFADFPAKSASCAKRAAAPEILRISAKGNSNFQNVFSAGKCSSTRYANRERETNGKSADSNKHFVVEDPNMCLGWRPVWWLCRL